MLKSMEIPKDLYNDISNYCKANSISNVDGFILKLLTRAYTLEKYGHAPALPIRITDAEPKTEELIRRKIDEPISPIPEEKSKKDIYGET